MGTGARGHCPRTKWTDTAAAQQAVPFRHGVEALTASRCALERVSAEGAASLRQLKLRRPGLHQPGLREVSMQSTAVLVSIYALMPCVFVIVAMVIAIIVAFARRDYTA